MPKSGGQAAEGHASAPPSPPVRAPAVSPVLARGSLRSRQALLKRMCHARGCDGGGACVSGGSASARPRPPACAPDHALWAHARACADPRCRVSRCSAGLEVLRHLDSCVLPGCSLCASVVASSPPSSRSSPPASPRVSPPEPPAREREVAPEAPAKRAKVEPPAGEEMREAFIPPPQAPRPTLPPPPPPPPEEVAFPNDGVSLCECFDADGLRLHLASLRLADDAAPLRTQKSWAARSDAAAAAAAAAKSGDALVCTACCSSAPLAFDPPRLECDKCLSRIPAGAPFFAAAGPARAGCRRTFCKPCHSKLGSNVDVGGGEKMRKACLARKTNVSINEPLYLCTVCGDNVHGVCALINPRACGAAAHGGVTCPSCQLARQVATDAAAASSAAAAAAACSSAATPAAGAFPASSESSTTFPNSAAAAASSAAAAAAPAAAASPKLKPRVPTTVRPASQLPAEALLRCATSDAIEAFLSSKLSWERAERARLLAKPASDVLTAEGLCVRVVSCVTKVLSVGPRFAYAFPAFPTSFTYSSKAAVLFQKREGVDVALFIMFVQEYGDDAPPPNARRVYLSYLDSVNHLQPDLRSARSDGVKLRTFVYQSVLQGYLAHVRSRGFQSVHIWSCPPADAGDDYIFYSHPAKQRRTTPARLREWYHAMIAAASADGTVASYGELRADLGLGDGTSGTTKPTRLPTDVPYFDGDFWPGLAEEHLVGHSKATLMPRLARETAARSMDFIVVHLAPPGGAVVVVDGAAPAAAGVNGRKGSGCASPPLLPPPPPPPFVRDAPDDTTACAFFDSRREFLSLCEGNRYQFDSLRRAKHSTSMVLYHLHCPEEPRFSPTCNVCCEDLPPGGAPPGWRCGGPCADFDVCDACQAASPHEHAVVRAPLPQPRLPARPPSAEDRAAKRENVRLNMERLVHASTCSAGTGGSPPCDVVACRNLRGLFAHIQVCEVGGGGGCRACRVFACLLEMHAKGCTAPISPAESDGASAAGGDAGACAGACTVPRCAQVKASWRESASRDDERRRAAFGMETE